jgi:hypothetical protein
VILSSAKHLGFGRAGDSSAEIIVSMPKDFRFTLRHRAVPEAKAPAARHAPNAVRQWQLRLIFLSCILLATSSLPAQVTREQELKAVFLWRLTQFTQWPADAFEHAESPIVLCVFGDSTLADAVTAAVRGETAQGRKLAVQPLGRSDQLKTCHVLYIGDPFARQIKEVAAAVRGKSILTVSDVEDFTLAHRGMIRFLTERNRIKLRINVKAVTAARLVLDPRLLRASEVVESD